MKDKKEKGSVTLFILIACMLMIVILLVINIGVMNKNASQEKNIDEMSKQYNQNETDLDSTYDGIVDKQGYVTKEEYENGLYYKPGEECTINLSMGGYLTNSKKSYVTTIFLEKEIRSDVKNIELKSSGGAIVVQDGNYLLGEAYNPTLSGYEILVDDYSKGTIRIRINVNSANSKAVNNDAVGIIIEDLKIKFI